MGIGNTGLPEQRAVSAGVVPPAGITPTTYYRWEREVLSGIGRKDAEGRSGGTFVELPAPQPLRNNSERTATLNIGSSSIDLYQEMGPELLRTLVELLRQC